jgi:hypothetical protein
VVEEALQKMTKKQGELAALGLPHWAKCGLGIQREYFGFRHHEETLE